ncbi:MAG TPA: menaquinone biosynthesis protein [Armatimonadetes bacterium]|nr:menaquinone biosynthesis protein [Armatimonadota bacterium]
MIQTHEEAVCYRLGAVPYLNGKPLIYDLEQNPRPNVTLSKAVPAVLRQRLRDGELDAALVSSITSLEDGTLYALPGFGVSARGVIDSVRLFCREEPRRLRRVALDAGSRTSAALIRILLPECFGVEPEYVTAPPDLAMMLKEADAALLIGDPAMRAYYLEAWPRDELQVLDLGEVWFRLTGLPFVYAVWAVRPEVKMGPLIALLAQAWEVGRTHLDTIATSTAEQLGLPLAVCRNYLYRIMRYELEEKEWEGLRCFQALAKRHGIIPADAPPVTIVSP